MELLLKITNAMHAEIKKHGLEILQHYPKDIQFDLNKIGEFADGNMQFAWCVGDLHTHIVPLGITVDTNIMVTYLTNLSSRDKFYLIDINKNIKDGFLLKELSRENFEALKSTKVNFVNNFNHNSNSFIIQEGGEVISKVDIDIQGNFADQIFNCKVQKTKDLSILSVSAVLTHVHECVNKMSGTLFSKREINFI